MSGINYLGKILVCPTCGSPRLIVEEASEIEAVGLDGSPRLFDLEPSYYCPGCQDDTNPTHAKAVLYDGALYIIVEDGVCRRYDIYLQPVDIYDGDIYFDRGYDCPEPLGGVPQSDITRALYRALDETTPPEQVQAALCNFLSMLPVKEG